MKTSYLCSFLLGVLAASPIGTSGATVELPAIEDVCLSLLARNATGTGADFVSGTVGPNGGSARNRALIRFNPATQIPSNAVISTARLELRVTMAPPGPNSMFGLHRVQRPWAETQATWTRRLTPNVLWGTPGAQAGTDYASVASAATLVAQEGSYSFSSGQLATDVQSWLTDPSTNFGWILISQSESALRSARRFGSRENFTAAARPRLVIEFELPPAPPEITRAVREGEEIQITFTAESGFAYAVEFRDSIEAGSWTLLTNVIARTSTFEAAVADAVGASSQRFYRIGKAPCDCD